MRRPEVFFFCLVRGVVDSFSMALNPEKGKTLGEFNVGLAAAVGVLNPLSAQLDALIAVGLGPFQAELSAQLQASLAAQASISLTIGDPLAALRAAISAAAQLQASLQAALQFPTVNLSLSAELAASAALAASLSARLGLLTAALEVALRVKLAAVKLAADLAASLSAGPVFGFTFEPGPLNDDLETIGQQIQTKFVGGLQDGSTVLAPSQPVYGVVLLTGSPTVFASIGAIIQV